MLTEGMSDADRFAEVCGSAFNQPFGQGTEFALGVIAHDQYIGRGGVEIEIGRVRSRIEFSHLRMDDAVECQQKGPRRLVLLEKGRIFPGQERNGFCAEPADDLVGGVVHGNRGCGDQFEQMFIGIIAQGRKRSVNLCRIKQFVPTALAELLRDDFFEQIKNNAFHIISGIVKRSAAGTAIVFLSLPAFHSSSSIVPRCFESRRRLVAKAVAVEIVHAGPVLWATVRLADNVVVRPAASAGHPVLELVMCIFTVAER